MRVQRFWLECLSQAGYLVSDPDAKEAVMIDPRRDVAEIVATLEAEDLQLKWILLTHLHADFVAGHLELAARTGATIALSAEAKATYPIEALRGGEQLAVGAITLEVLATPGHTPDSLCFLAREGGKAKALFSGDTLFVGDVGRPDLMAAAGFRAEDLARALFRSLRDQILPLPDEVVVWPGHGAGSLCGKSLGTEASTTIGTERARNPALQIDDEEAFVAAITEGQPLSPAYFGHAARRNREGHALLDAVLAQALVPYPLERVAALARDPRWQVVDVREAEAFQAGHLPGSLNVGLEGRFATWAGSVLDPETDILLIAPLGQEEEAAMRLGRIGFDRVRGFLKGGAEVLDAAELRTTPRLTIDEVRARQAAGDLVLIDVRQPGEFESGHLEGAQSVPVGTLPGALADLPRDRDLLFICRTGYRSTVATSLAERVGLDRVADLRGGMLGLAGTASCATSPRP